MPWPVVLTFTVVIFLIGAFLYFKSYIRKRTSHETVLAEIRDEVNRLLMRIDETTNRDITLIEDKEESVKALLKDLNTIIEETERRLMVYTRELDRSLVNERAYRELGRTMKQPENVEKKTESLPENVQEEPSLIPPSPGEKIKQLANSGFSATVIASKLGLSISEVELALDLMERKVL